MPIKTNTLNNSESSAVKLSPKQKRDLLKKMENLEEGQERWKPVMGFESQYECSDMGRFRSILYRNSNVTKIKPTPKILGQHLTTRGYFTVYIKNKNRRAHRVILETFIGPCPDGHETCHLNGIRHDNRLVNLKWGTGKENSSHRKIHGTDACGERSGTSKLKNEDIPAIFHLRKIGKTLQEIATLYGVSKSSIGNITTRKKWAHINITNI